MMLTHVKQSLLVAGTALVLAAAASAQVETTTDTKTDGHAAVTTKVENGTVIYVSGNDLLVKDSEGNVRHFPNVSESARVEVDGKMLGIHDLKPGMHLTRTITTTTTPKMVTTVQTVTGKVWHVTPPLAVILTLEDGKNQEFKIPNGQKFSVDGQMVDAFGLKKGMTINATKIVETPMTVVTQQRKLTGKMPPPPPPVPVDQPILVMVAVPVQQQAAAPAPAAAPVQTAAAEPAPTKLPKTGSSLPLVALLGLTSLSLALASRIVRSRV